MQQIPFERRRFIKTSALSLFGINTLVYTSAMGNTNGKILTGSAEPMFYRYPAISDNMVSTVVGAAHGNLDKVKEMVNQRPELAGASWDWGFGDFETAIGAASHVGRRDIAEFLISHGARPDIFTYTMMGMLRSVQEIIETVPGIQSHTGPHGITLLQHAKNRLSAKDVTATEADNLNKMINYLQGLGNADVKPESIEMTDDEKQKYPGEYRFGDGEGEILVAEINSRKILQIGRKGSSGRGLLKTDEHTFSPVGAPSVKIIFKMKDDKAVSLSIHEPEPLVNAVRV